MQLYSICSICEMNLVSQHGAVILLSSQTTCGVYRNENRKKRERKCCSAAIMQMTVISTHCVCKCRALSRPPYSGTTHARRDEPSVDFRLKTTTAQARAYWFITSSRRRSRDLWRNARRHD